MNSTDLRNAFRSDVRDEVTPYLWSDSEIYRYINDAQMQFCKREGGIRDATSSITQVPVVIGEAFADISPSILKVIQATRASDGRELEILNLETVQQMHASSTDYGALASPNSMNTPGSLLAVILGMEAFKVRWIHIPAATDVVNLVVDRMALTPVTGANIDLEIAEEHHEHLLLWVKHRALLKQDAETYDKGRSDQFRAAFETYCADAKITRGRREHVYRTVAYGGY